MVFKTAFVFLFCFLTIFASSAIAKPIRKRSRKIPGSFIVQLDGDCNRRCRAAIRKALASNPLTSGCTLGKRGSKIGSISFEDVKCPLSVSIQETSVASTISAQSNIESVPGIQLVAQDEEVLIASGEPTSLWGVDEADGGVRKVKGSPVRDGFRTCSVSSQNGTGVNVWILDTGCTPSSAGLCEGYYGGENVCKDNNGHGDHVGGTATHPTFGVATGAVRSCVKVLGDNGSGSFSNVIKGIEFAVANKNKFGKGDVINLSLAGPKYDPVNNAVREARKSGIFFAIAAGNSADNACNYSPASTPGRGIFTVQAHDENLKAASFTNYATKELKCTDLSAPGVSIESIGGRFSGTSMASPHVAGACAVLLSDGLKPTRKRLTAQSVRIKISGTVGRRTLGLACA
ncbi:Proteinase K [Gracilariopsis chorda]|uniref:Proteinase K n=1 Tax=Gracilariopsis chorda TaxID=448386 RepID=A0A2V3J661_9FLOR|nr:Proteinase K [Gracilariopsis chorda]|eukprot:PXF49612.1 Proteinase K [Gracilariopsis chorda]